MSKLRYSEMLPVSIKSVHFIGIGGSGVKGIASLFLAHGINVSGSDLSDSAALKKLRHLGARIFIGHDMTHLGNADTVVYSSAISPSNPEYVAAKKAGIPVLHRSQALKWLVGNHRLISIAGTHGKTTSTGMIVAGLQHLGRKPSFVNGGDFQTMQSSSSLGDDHLFVIEADESDGSFLQYETSIAVVTNIEQDHLDHYGNQEAADEAFLCFVQNAKECIIISSDDPGVQRLRDRLVGTKITTFGTSKNADICVKDVFDHAGRVSFSLETRSAIATARLLVPGRHNAINAAAAVAVLLQLGYCLYDALQAVEKFPGISRRFELMGNPHGVSVYDDYAHHPTEIAATLQAARAAVGQGHIVVVHQPFTFTRTVNLANDFAQVLERYADHTVVLDIHSTRDTPTSSSITGELVSKAFADSNRVRYIKDWHEAANYVASIVDSGDFVFTMGCGDVNLLVPILLCALEEMISSKP